MKNILHILGAERRLSQDDLAKLLEAEKETNLDVLFFVTFANLFARHFELSAVKVLNAKDAKFSQRTQKKEYCQGFSIT